MNKDEKIDQLVRVSVISLDKVDLVRWNPRVSATSLGKVDLLRWNSRHAGKYKKKISFKQVFVWLVQMKF